MFLIQKYTQYKAAQAEQNKKKVTEKELAQLNHKIDKLLTRLDEHEPEVAANQDEECVVCVNAKATMTTYPCAHRVICRKCFVKTIQMAVAQRLLPLRCVICRAKILRLKHTNNTTMPLPNSSSGLTNESGSSSNSSYNWYHVPQSASLYSVTSNNSGVSGVSSTSSNSSKSSYKTCASSFSAFRKSHSAYAKMGYEPLRNSSSSPPPRPLAITCSSTPTSKNTHGSSKSSNKSRSSPSLEINRSSPTTSLPPPKGKFKLVQEFQREFRMGKNTLPGGSNKKSHHQSQLTSSHSFTIHPSSSSSSKSSSASGAGATGSSRIKCAKQLINQAQCPTAKNPEADGGTLSTGANVSSNTTSNKIPKSVSFSHHHHGQGQRQLKPLRNTHSSDSVSTLKHSAGTGAPYPSPEKAKPSNSNPNSSKFLTSVTQKYHKTSPISKNVLAMRFFKSS